MQTKTESARRPLPCPAEPMCQAENWCFGGKASPAGASGLVRGIGSLPYQMIHLGKGSGSVIQQRAGR